MGGKVLDVRGLAVAVGNRVPTRVGAMFRSDSRVASAARPLVNRVIPNGPTLVTVRSGEAKGARLFIDPRSEKFYWTGQHETHVQAALASLLRPGAIFWDIGAHVGFFSVLASRLVGPRGRVIAFEPMTPNRHRLELSLAASNAENVEIRPCAVGGTAGTVLLRAHEASVMWTLVAERGGDDGELVECATLDDLATVSAPPTVIKIDAEGVELEVLKGGHNLLKIHSPSIVVEFSSARDVDEARRAFPSYSFEALGQNHWLMRSSAATPSPGRDKMTLDCGHSDGLTANSPRRTAHPRQQFHDFIAPMLRPEVRILDIGSGRKPALAPPERPANCHYVGLDISPDELALAPDGSYDETWISDVTERVTDLEGRFDLILSWQVLEHVRPIDAAFTNIHAYLAPGGRFVAMLSGSYAAFAVANRLIPDGLGKALMKRLIKREPDTVFPAQYDRCTYGALSNLLAPWASAEIVPFYHGGVYFGFSSVLQRFYLGYERWISRKGYKNLATHYVIIAKRKSELPSE